MTLSRNKHGPEEINKCYGIAQKPFLFLKVAFIAYVVFIGACLWYMVMRWVMRSRHTCITHLNSFCPPSLLPPFISWSPFLSPKIYLPACYCLSSLCSLNYLRRGLLPWEKSHHALASQGSISLKGREFPLNFSSHCFCTVTYTLFTTGEAGSKQSRVLVLPSLVLRPSFLLF